MAAAREFFSNPDLVSHLLSLSPVQVGTSSLSLTCKHLHSLLGKERRQHLHKRKLVAHLQSLRGTYCDQVLLFLSHMNEDYRTRIHHEDGLERDWACKLDPGWNPLGFGIFDAWPHCFFLFDASTRPFFTYHLGPLSRSCLPYPGHTGLLVRTQEGEVLE